MFSPHQHSYFSWNDQLYSDFMMDFLLNLEPRNEEPLTKIYSELDEINEVIFFNKGTYEIGFQLNNKEYYPLKY